ncbi:unnamed protein product [Bursaphelenchus xylophilus]|nr:unnamed protein product [Bursaphelenchus xylophilus]CAG9101219.1 unnamed protein product [Bursaphelenchus xylophilus]
MILKSGFLSALGGLAVLIQVLTSIALAEEVPEFTIFTNATGPLWVSMMFLPASFLQISIIPVWHRKTMSLLASLGRTLRIGSIFGRLQTPEPQATVTVYINIKRKVEDGKLQEREIYFEMFDKAWR